MAKKICFITTVNHNVGDDFVREGIKFLLRQYFSSTDIVFTNIHKHSPITSRHGFERLQYHHFMTNPLDSLIPLHLTRDRIIESDLIVQCGAPVYWCHPLNHCANNEWYRPLIKRRFAKNTGAKLWNIAAGSCQKYHSDGSELLQCHKCSQYISIFTRLSNVVTVRDALSHDILNALGFAIPVIPCSSIFANDEHTISDGGNDYVAVNYMSGGAHYTLGQKIDTRKWQSEFSKFYYYIKSKERVVFVCHNHEEYHQAKAIDPAAEIFYKKNDYKAYIDFYSKARCGIMNRIHGAYILASFGKPSVIIGNDSRARMAEVIGLKSFFVNDADCALLHSQYERLRDDRAYKHRFAQIKDAAFHAYMQAFASENTATQ